jgi:hypothetical protein
VEVDQLNNINRRAPLDHNPDNGSV